MLDLKVPTCHYIISMIAPRMPLLSLLCILFVREAWLTPLYAHDIYLFDRRRWRIYFTGSPLIYLYILRHRLLSLHAMIFSPWWCARLHRYIFELASPSLVWRRVSTLRRIRFLRPHYSLEKIFSSMILSSPLINWVAGFTDYYCHIHWQDILLLIFLC